MRLRSAETLVGMQSCTGNPSAAPSMANAMPVLPLVASSRVLPGASNPRAMASRTIALAARSFTLPPGFTHSALASTVIPGRSRAIFSSRSNGVFPMRSIGRVPGSACRCIEVIRILCQPSLHSAVRVGKTAIMKECGVSARLLFLSSQMGAYLPMARKSKDRNFDEMLDALRAHSFDVSPFAGVANGMIVTRAGVAAVVVPGVTNERWESGGARLAVTPGLLVRGEIARLLDRGYQKFIKTSKFELPATSAQLHAIQDFTEELN